MEINFRYCFHLILRSFFGCSSEIQRSIQSEHPDLRLTSTSLKAIWNQTTFQSIDTSLMGPLNCPGKSPLWPRLCHHAHLSDRSPLWPLLCHHAHLYFLLQLLLSITSMAFSGISSLPITFSILSIIMIASSASCQLSFIPLYQPHHQIIYTRKHYYLERARRT